MEIPTTSNNLVEVSKVIQAKIPPDKTLEEPSAASVLCADFSEVLVKENGGDVDVNVEDLGPGNVESAHQLFSMESRNGKNASGFVDKSWTNGFLAEEIMTKTGLQASDTNDKMLAAPLCSRLENGGVPALKVCSALDEDERPGIEKDLEDDNNLELQGDISAKKIEVSGDSLSLFVQVFGPLDDTFDDDDENCFGEYSLSASNSDRENLPEGEGLLLPDNREDRKAELSEIQGFQFYETGNSGRDGEETVGNRVEADAVGSGDAIDTDQDKIPINKASEKKGENQALLSEMESFFKIQICGNNMAEKAVDLASIYWEREGDKYCQEDIVKVECLVPPSEAEILASSLSSKTTDSKVSSTGNSDEMCEGKHESRDRKKSKYLSPPYVNINEGQNDSRISGQNESEVVKEDVRVDVNNTASQSMGSTPKVSSSGRNTRRNRSKRAVKVQIMFESERTHASSVEMLSELRLTALDCLYPNKSKYFNSAERFFSGFRSLAFHDEFKHAMAHEQSEDEEGTEQVMAKQCRTTLATSAPGEHKVIAFNASKVKHSQDTSHCPPGFVPKRRGRKNKADMTSVGSDGKPVNGSAAIDWSSTTSQSVVIDFQNGTVAPETQRGGNQTSQQTRIIPGLPDLNATNTSPPDNGSNVNSSLRCPLQMGLLFPVGKPERKKRKRREKATDSLKSDVTSAIPDLNGNAALQETNFTIPEGKPLRKRRRKSSTANFCHYKMQTNGDALGTALLLKFASGSSMPSRESLITTFGGFGPLKESETQILNDGSAQVVFVRSYDAGIAFRSLEKNSFFGPALVNYRLYHLSVASRALESGGHLHMSPSLKPADAFKTPAAQPQPNEVPDLSYIRQNLEMMTSMLEKAGDDLSPGMRAKLEAEIKGLLNKVRNISGS